MTAPEEAAVRAVRVFSWEKVDPGLTRALIAAAYRETSQGGEADRVAQVDEKVLAGHAERVLGRPLAAVNTTPAVVDVLLMMWLPEMSMNDRDELIREIQLSLSGTDRTARPETKAAQLDFIRRRNVTPNLRSRVRAAFLRAHKTSRPVSQSTGQLRAQHEFPRELVGLGSTPTVEPYPHQVQAWEKLDALAASRGDRRAGQLVLPTGSGKTFTAVRWLLLQLSKDPALRVLWIADQQELLDQAARQFEADAETMPEDFVTRRLRVLHSAAGPVTSLADDELDVACVTRQSLIAGGAAAHARLKVFLSRPTIVVVDEAHHAVATTYQQLLNDIEQLAPRVMLLGLTATPWPSGQGMVRRLRERFPDALADVSMARLINERILAQPVVHTVATGEYVRLEAAERALIAKSDFPPAILSRLDQEGRNHLVVSKWTAHPAKWGKTLVFAGTIAHADHLGEVFTQAGVRCLVVHSHSEQPRTSLLREFREAVEPMVLVSVGMLLEGVDLPDARTAVLARPTTSRVLMKQMVGRVLRGPRAGGDTVAHIVALEDHWADGIDVLSPIDLRELIRPEIEVDTAVGARRLPPLRDDITGAPIAVDVQRRIERAYAELAGHPTVAVTDATLVGYYELTDVNVPVFDHTSDVWRELITGKLAGRKLATHSPRDLFADLPVPRPTTYDVDAVLDYLAATTAEPPLITVTSTFSVGALAQQLLDEAAMTERDKIEWKRTVYESTVARSAYPSFLHFDEAINQEVIALSGHAPAATNPEKRRLTDDTRKLPTRKRPTLTVDPERLIKPLLKDTATAGWKLLLDAGETDYAAILNYLPAVQWTRRPVRTTYAVWVPRISGKSKGVPIIRVNRMLQAPIEQVPDDLLQFLLWHELCHHIHPGYGHDAEFHRLLVLWPEASRLDHQLDTLDERFNLGSTGTVHR